MEYDMRMVGGWMHEWRARIVWRAIHSINDSPTLCRIHAGENVPESQVAADAVEQLYLQSICQAIVCFSCRCCTPQGGQSIAHVCATYAAPVSSCGISSSIIDSTHDLT